ncbi:MAG: hypothetical protein IPO78_12800 [Saprospiraceae bacterium]|nr:hypothetical protein [Saprospiraceae bacterium]
MSFSQTALDHFSREKLNLLNKEVMKSYYFAGIISELFKADFLRYLFNESIEYCYELLNHIEYDWLKTQLHAVLKEE